MSAIGATCWNDQIKSFIEHQRGTFLTVVCLQTLCDEAQTYIAEQKAKTGDEAQTNYVNPKGET